MNSLAIKLCQILHNVHMKLWLSFPTVLIADKAGAAVSSADPHQYLVCEPTTTDPWRFGHVTQLAGSAQRVPRVLPRSSRGECLHIFRFSTTAAVQTAC